MQLIQRLNEVISEFHLLKHPFYQAWSRGELSRDLLQSYGKQYYQQVASFPRFISRVHTGCPVIAARKVLLENLVDEEIHGTDHPALWMQFVEGMGVNQMDVLKEAALPETMAMVDTYYELAESHWTEGLCALYAYECQVPEVSASKIAGLKQFYGVEDEKTLEFFAAHQQYDVEHSKRVAELIECYVEPEQAEHATRKAAQALWGFLNGMCRVGNICCH
ncbi:MAG: CADD family putative folate metabolism protein [Gammaproteobacteria bacterium]|nr:MAG: CADD family putative folate metabolism protein [Gammaproteobacteria bacterium]